MTYSTSENKHEKKDEKKAKDKNKLLRCDICAEECAMEVTMIKHTNTQQSRITFVFELCKKILKIHMQEIHQDDHASKITDYQNNKKVTKIYQNALCVK